MSCSVCYGLGKLTPYAVTNYRKANRLHSIGCLAALPLALLVPVGAIALGLSYQPDRTVVLTFIGVASFACVLASAISFKVSSNLRKRADNHQLGRVIHPDVTNDRNA